jgi:hypothetical protein
MPKSYITPLIYYNKFYKDRKFIFKMVARVDREKNEVVFSEPVMGCRKRVEVRRPLKPFCLENVDEYDFKFLCSLPDKRFNLRDGELGYTLYYDPKMQRVYFKINENLKTSPESFGFSAHYDAVTSETLRLWEEVIGFRNNGKLYSVVASLLKEAYSLD